MVERAENLSSSSRSRLNELRETERLNNRTSERLSSGRRVNRITDDPEAFVRAQALVNRASDLTQRVDVVGQATSSIQAAQAGAEAIDKLNQQLKGIKSAAQATDNQQELERLADQFNEVSRQIDNLANDTSFQGRNIVNNGNASNNQTVQVDTNSTVTIQSKDLSSTGLGIPQNVTAAQLDDETFLATLDQTLSDATSSIRSAQADQGLTQATLQVREDFARQQANINEEGADKLTLADTNAEGARAVAGQTRQLLGVNSLSLSAQFERSILRLFQN